MRHMDRSEYVAHHLSLLSTNLIHERNRARMSQDALAVHADVDRNTIMYAESAGHIGMQLGTILKIAWSLDLQPVQLFGFANNTPRVTPTEYEVIQALRKVLPKESLS